MFSKLYNVPLHVITTHYFSIPLIISAVMKFVMQVIRKRGLTENPCSVKKQSIALNEIGHPANNCLKEENQLFFTMLL